MFPSISCFFLSNLIPLHFTLYTNTSTHKQQVEHLGVLVCENSSSAERLSHLYIPHCVCVFCLSCRQNTAVSLPGPPLTRQPFLPVSQGFSSGRGWQLCPRLLPVPVASFFSSRNQVMLLYQNNLFFEDLISVIWWIPWRAQDRLSRVFNLMTRQEKKINQILNLCFRTV